MTKRESCLAGGAECNYSELHELALVEAVVRALEQYNKDQRTDPCPHCLRDAVLAVAALLHLEAVRLDGASSLLGMPEGVVEGFGRVARDKLRGIAEVTAFSAVGLKQ